jgi:ABC-type sugar transport system ATPase subunit
MLHFHHISKRFGGVQALRDVSFEVESGSAHAIVGENGAGKSTLMKIVAGVHLPDDGYIELGGKRVLISSPRRASELGIALVPQEPALCPNLSVAENLILGHEPQKAGFLNREATRQMAENALQRAALDVSPRALVESLSSAQKHLLQIARALAQNARILILDEPTAALSEGEAAHLFERLKNLQNQGVTILYISHRLPEIFDLCDSITTLRDGRHVATQKTRDVSTHIIVQQMVGRELEQEIGEDVPVFGENKTLLRVENLSCDGEFQDVSFAVRAGEIVALAGLVGSGRSEIARCLFGLNRPSSGAMTLNEKPFAPQNPRDAIRAGLALVPEDRRHQGVIAGQSVRDNLSLPALSLGFGGLARGGFVQTKTESESAQKRIAQLAIKTGGADAPVETLSGGNQQKVVLGKWLSTEPQLFIVDEPTQGVDVGAKAQVHRLLRDLAAQGRGVLMISSDLPEVLHLAHRILVMREGRLVGELGRGASPEDVMRLAALG